PDAVIVVAHDGGNAFGANALGDLVRVCRVADQVAETVRGVDGPGPQVSEDGVECGEVAVNVTDDGDAHGDASLLGAAMTRRRPAVRGASAGYGCTPRTRRACRALRCARRRPSPARHQIPGRTRQSPSRRPVRRSCWPR